MRYRKKPVVIEAMQIPSVMDERFLVELDKVRVWIGEGANILVDEDNFFNFGMIIKTLEGDMKATPGDYIIKGVQGEFYPCKPDIFEQTYEKVDE